MLPKPNHLSPEYASVFQDPSVIDAYHLRPPYAEAVFEALEGLIVDAPRTVLDVGCGTGDIARRLASRADRLGAVDISAGMIEAGRQLPGGDQPNLHWIHGSVEEAPLDPPYALITAGESLHWLDWERAFPRFLELLTPRGMLALINRTSDRRAEVRERIDPLFGRFSTNRAFRSYDLIEELELRGLFEKQGETRTPPTRWTPTIDEYIESCHSANGFSRARMTQVSAADFDAELRGALRELRDRGVIEEHDGRLQLEVAARITWGWPKF